MNNEKDRSGTDSTDIFWGVKNKFGAWLRAGLPGMADNLRA
jgi:hypothetical protein